MRPSWLGSMVSALAASLGTPEWWALALAAFLVRGGILLLVLPILALPTPAGLITQLSPGIESLLLGTPSLGGAVLGAASLAAIVVLLGLAGLAGSWLELALVRDVAASDELDATWTPVGVSSWRALGLHLVAHLPTLLALGYAIVRVIIVGYAQSTTPDEPGVPIVDRVIARVPDAIAAVVIAWLAGEVVGGLAVRRAAMGQGNVGALAGSVRQLVGPRGLATLGATTVVLVAVAAPFALAAQRAWEHVRGYLLVGADPVQLAAAVVVLVATWVLGLTVVGAALAWRATAWTAELTVR